MPHKWSLWLIVIVMLSLSIGCQMVSEEPEVETDQISEDEQVKKDIEILIELLAAPSAKIGEVCRRLIDYGDQAVPELARNMNNNSHLVRVCSLYCLGEIYRQKKSAQVRNLKAKIAFCLQDPMLQVRLEAATLLCSLDDYSGIPILIDALRHEKPYTRMVAAQVLRDKFQLTFGYYYQDPPATREKAIASWQEWWQTKRQQYESGKVN